VARHNEIDNPNKVKKDAVGGKGLIVPDKVWGVPERRNYLSPSRDGKKRKVRDRIICRYGPWEPAMGVKARRGSKTPNILPEVE